MPKDQKGLGYRRHVAMNTVAQKKASSKFNEDDTNNSPSDEEGKDVVLIKAPP